MKTKLIILLGLLAFTLSVLAGDLVGMGVVIVDKKKEGEPLRTGVVYPGSPAERAGIKSDWYLISVDGTNVVSMSLVQSMSIMRGPIGTSVALELADSTRSQTNKFTVKRERMVFSGYGADTKVEFFDH
jgi:C-terminal processing protease CtpA/Prc